MVLKFELTALDEQSQNGLRASMRKTGAVYNRKINTNFNVVRIVCDCIKISS